MEFLDNEADTSESLTLMNILSRSFFLFQVLSRFSALCWLEAITEQARHNLSPAPPSNCSGKMMT